MKQLTEKQFQAQVVKLAKLFGWTCYHTHDSRRCAAGFPDLVLVKAGRPVIFAELKTEIGQTNAAQEHWLSLLRTTPSQAFLWRPAQWKEIEQVLGGL